VQEKSVKKKNNRDVEFTLSLYLAKGYGKVVIAMLNPLLIALDENARQSYQSLGRRVSLSAPAVRDRLNRLRSKGIGRCYTSDSNKSLFTSYPVISNYRGP
jgi:AsnC-type helix-turn-helix domain